MEDLFTAVLSPSTNQSSQLAQPPNTISNVPVMTVPQHAPGILYHYLLKSLKCCTIIIRVTMISCSIKTLGFSFRRSCYVPSHACYERYDGSKSGLSHKFHDAWSRDYWHVLSRSPDAFS